MTSGVSPFIFYPSFPSTWLGSTICFGYDSNLQPICPDETKEKRTAMLETEAFKKAMQADINLGNTGEKISRLPELISPAKGYNNFEKPILMGVNMTQNYTNDKIKEPVKNQDQFFSHKYLQELFPDYTKTPKYMCIMPECIVGSCKFDIDVFKEIEQKGNTNLQTVRVEIMPNCVPFNKVQSSIFRDITDTSTKLITAANNSSNFYHKIANLDKFSLIYDYQKSIVTIDQKIKTNHSIFKGDDTDLSNINNPSAIPHVNEINTTYDSYMNEVKTAYKSFETSIKNIGTEIPKDLINPGDYPAYETFFGEDKKSFQNTILLQNQPLTLCNWFEDQEFLCNLTEIKSDSKSTTNVEVKQTFNFSRPDMLIGYSYHKDYKPFNITRIPIASEKDFYNDPIIKNTYKLGDNLEENRKKVFMGGAFRDVFTLQLTDGKPSAVTENERTFIILNGPSYRRVPPTNFKGFSPILADVQVNEVDKNGKKEVEIITVEQKPNYYQKIKNNNLNSYYFFGPYVFKEDSTADNLQSVNWNGSGYEKIDNVQKIYDRMTEGNNAWPEKFWNLDKDLKKNAIRYKLTKEELEGEFNDQKAYYDEKTGINKQGFPGADYSNKMFKVSNHSFDETNKIASFTIENYENPTYKDERTEKFHITRKTFPIHELIYKGILELLSNNKVIELKDNNGDYLDINSLTTNQYNKEIILEQKYFDLGSEIKKYKNFTMNNGQNKLEIKNGTVCPYKLALLKGRCTILDPIENYKTEVSVGNDSVFIFTCIFPAVVFNNVQEKENFVCQFVPTYQYIPDWYFKSNGLPEFSTLIPAYTPDLINKDKIGITSEDTGVSPTDVFIRPEDIYLSEVKGFYISDTNKYTNSKEGNTNNMGDLSLYITPNGFIQTDLSYMMCEHSTNSNRFSKEMNILQGRVMRLLKEKVIPNPDWYKVNAGNDNKNKEWELSLKKYYNDKADGRETFVKEPFRCDYDGNKCRKIICIIIIVIVVLIIFGLILYFTSNSAPNNYNKFQREEWI